MLIAGRVLPKVTQHIGSKTSMKELSYYPPKSPGRPGLSSLTFPIQDPELCTRLAECPHPQPLS